MPKSVKCTIPGKLIAYRLEIEYVPARSAWGVTTAPPAMKYAEAETLDEALKELAEMVKPKKLPRRPKKAKTRLQRLMGKGII